MWLGTQRPSGEIPAWSFIMQEKTDLAAVRGVLSKAIIETKSRMMAADLKINEDDRNWLEAAVVAEADVDMSDAEAISEFEDTQSEADIDYNKLYD